MAGPNDGKADRQIEEDKHDRTNDDWRHDRDDENHFSQRDDDRAGRNWHGMNSDYEIEDVGRFHPDQDEDDDRRGRYRTSEPQRSSVDAVLQTGDACGS